MDDLHTQRMAERVVERGDRSWLLEKVGEAAEVVRQAAAEGE